MNWLDINYRGGTPAKTKDSNADRQALHLSIQTKLDYLAEHHHDHYRAVLDKANAARATH